MQERDVQRSIGAFGVVLVIVGFIIGISAFILPGQLIGLTGPAVLVSYIIAGLVALLSCLAAAQIGVLLPSDGGSFVAVATLISPFWGVVSIWVLLIAAVVANAFMAMGFASYLQTLVPGVPESVVAAIAVCLFGLANAMGVRGVVRIQGVLVVLFLAAVLIFLGATLPALEPARLQPFAPNGWGSVFYAATLAYFSFGGFLLLLDVAGEIRQPGKTIPRALTISFAIVIAVYLGIALGLLGAPAEYLGAKVPVLAVAEARLPVWLQYFFVFAVLAAAATSINSLILAYSRDIMVVARSGFLPKRFAEVTKSGYAPIYAISLLVLLSLAALGLGENINQFVVVAVIAVMIQQVLIGLCLWRVPRVLAVQYAAAPFRLPLWFLRSVSIALIVVSLAFMGVLLSAEPVMTVAVVLLVAAGIGYFVLVTRWQKKRGSDVLSLFQGQVAEMLSGSERNK